MNDIAKGQTIQTATKSKPAQPKLLPAASKTGANTSVGKAQSKATTKPTAGNAAAGKSANKNPADGNAANAKPVNQKPADAKPADAKPATGNAPASSTAPTKDAKNNCPAKQVTVCDVKKYKMTVTPHKSSDPYDKPDANAASLETEKNLRRMLDSTEQKELQRKTGRSAQGYAKLLMQYDLVIETIASYPSAGESPDVTVDLKIDAEWEGKCANHPQLAMRTHGSPSSQDATLEPAAYYADDIAMNQRAADVLTGHGDLPKTHDVYTTKFRDGQLKWPVNTKSVKIKGLMAYSALGDNITGTKVDEEVPNDAASAAGARNQRSLGLFRSILGVITTIKAFFETVDVEIYADSEGVATPQRKPNKQLNGLLRIYRDTEFALEMGFPLGNKYTKKKLAGSAMGAMDNEEPIIAGTTNADGSTNPGEHRYELKLKFGKAGEIVLAGDPESKNKLSKVVPNLGATLTDWKNSVKTGGAAHSAATDGRAAAGTSITQGRTSRDAYLTQQAQDDASLSRVPRRYQRWARQIVGAWRFLTNALTAVNGISAFIHKLLFSAPKFGWFCELEIAFFAMTMSLSYSRATWSGDPVLNRLLPTIPSFKMTIEGTLVSLTGKIGFGVEAGDPDWGCKAIMALTAEIGAKAPIKIELTVSENPLVVSPSGNLDIKLKIEATVMLGKFVLSASSEITTGLRIEMTMTRSTTKSGMGYDLKIYTIPVKVSGGFTEPLFGTKHSWSKVLVSEEIIHNEVGQTRIMEWWT